MQSFGQVVCIGSWFYFKKNKKEKKLVTSSKCNFPQMNKERELSLEFTKCFYLKKKNMGSVVAHNGKEFGNYPYLCRRMLIHRIWAFPEPFANSWEKKTLGSSTFGIPWSYGSLGIISITPETRTFSSCFRHRIFQR